MKGNEAIGPTLQAAIAHVRRELGDATASVAVIAPSRVNANLARRELAFAGPFIRVAFVTPGQLHAELAEPRLRQLGLQPEPPGWLRATAKRLVDTRDDLSPYGLAMRDHGWLPALTAALGTLENALVGPGELRAMVTADLDSRERAELLAALLEAIDIERKEASMASPRQVALAACHSVVEGAVVPANTHRAAVLLGDARMPRAVSDTLVAYLERRPVARVDLPHMAALPAAIRGLTAAAPKARPFAVAIPKPTIQLVRTPDPMREVTEAVREVQAALADGVAPDRIALVLPDPAEAVTLREALARAGIPATWQTGPALALAPAARFALHALGLRAGADSVRAWYELLQLPGLRLRANAGESVARGRGRWRRLLSRCGAYRGSDTILAALDAYQAELAARTDDAERRQKDTEAFDTLRAAMRQVLGDLPAGQPEPLGRWARQLSAFMSKWWPLTPDGRALDRLLEGWARSDIGPAVGPAEAHATFAEAFEATVHLRGSLKDPSIRVLSPMQLIGGRFDRVLVTGLDQGRFPRDPSPDPILTDALIDGLPPEAGLFRSGDRVALERRRFAAIRSAATEQLWCSVPRLDLAGGRPLLPGSLIMGLAASSAGERPTFGAFEAGLARRGSRSRTFPRDPANALGTAEHLLARLHQRETRAAALGALADHPRSRRLLRLHRAADRLARGDRSPDLRPYAGFVQAAPCPGLDGTPLSPRDLARLVDDPLRFFFSKVLGARRPDPLYEGWLPDVASGRVEREVVAAELTSSERLAERLVTAFDRAFAAQAERAAYASADTLERIAEGIRRRLRDLAAQGPSGGPVVALEGQRVTGDLPWTLTGGEGRRVGSGLQWIELDDKRFPKPRSKTRPSAALYEASAHATTGTEPSALEWVGVGTKVDGSLGLHGAAALEALGTVTALVTAHLYHGYAPSGVRLKSDARGTRWNPAAGDAWLDEWMEARQ